MFDRIVKIVLVSGSVAGMLYAGQAGERGLPASEGRVAVMSQERGHTVTKDGVSESVGLQKQHNDTLNRGTEIRTHIDARLQKRIERILDRAKAALDAREILAMVMDSKTGAMLAMATSGHQAPPRPGDENAATPDPKFGGYLYEPGSVMMPFIVATLLESRPNLSAALREKFDTGYDRYPIDGRVYVSDDVKKKSQTLSDILLHSSNIGIARVAERIAPDRFAEALERYGFGRPSGIDLPRDANGTLKDRAVYEKKLHRVSTGYGYGITVTPLQLLKAYSVFANEGQMSTPRIARSAEVKRKEVLPQPVAKRVKEMLVRVVNEGTGRKARVAGLTIGGKTGTAHIAEKGRYLQKYHSSFYGFAEDGRGHSYTLGVLVIEPKAPEAYFASRSAAPVFGKIVESMAAEKLLIPETVKKRTDTDGHTEAKTRSPLPDAKVIKPFGRIHDKVYDIEVFNNSVTLQPAKGKERVHSVLDGRVIFAGARKNLGKTVVISHGNRLYTVYAGLSAIAPSVRVGKELEEGTMLGEAKEKLVFQVTRGGKPVDPMELIGK